MRDRLLGAKPMRRAFRNGDRASDGRRPGLGGRFGPMRTGERRWLTLKLRNRVRVAAAATRSEGTPMLLRASGLAPWCW